MKLTLLLIPLILLSSCTIDWNDEKDKKIAELEKQVQDDTFKKKQECLSYEKDAREKNPNNDEYYFSSIFYSKKYNTCIFRMSGHKTPFNHILYNYFGGETIMSKDDICTNSACYEVQKEFNKILED